MNDGWNRNCIDDSIFKRRAQILTSASRSKRPKSSLRVRTRSWADRFMDNRVKPLMSAKRMLQRGENESCD